MINYYLPKTIIIAGRETPIRSDYRPVLDIVSAMQDDSLTDYDKIDIIMTIFYPTQLPPEYTEIALRKAFYFIAGCLDDDTEPVSGRVVDNSPSRDIIYWAHDFPYFITSLNRVAGVDIRGLDYLHWWSFTGLFHEMGDCFYNRILGIREQRVHGKKLSKEDAEFYKRYKAIIDFKPNERKAQEYELLKQLGVI